MSATDFLPDWPPPNDEPIGVERARAYIAWIRDHAKPQLTRARRMIDERYSGVATRTSAVTVEQLASWTFTTSMHHLSIGVVWASVSGGRWAMVDIVINRDGTLGTRPGWNMG